jgi:hypothetical protein
MIRLINYEKFSTNDDEYLKLDDEMRGGNLRSLQPLHLVFLQKIPRHFPSYYTLLHPSSQTHDYSTDPATHF